MPLFFSTITTTIIFLLAPIFRRVVLPALLLLAAGWGLGCYFETNDDPAIILMLRGNAAAAPVSNLHLYFHGFSNLLAVLYQTWPALPWYGIVLYGLLYIATVLVFTVLDQLLIGRVPMAWLITLLVLFFLTAWLEHSLWFNYTRVPVLLSGSGILFAAQRPQSRWALLGGLLAFALSWLIRPGIAVLGGLLALPGAYWVSGRCALPILTASLLWTVLGMGVLMSLTSKQIDTYRAIDLFESKLIDYQVLHPVPRTTLDSVSLKAMRYRMRPDTTLVNEALFRRIAPPNLGYFLRYTAPAKLQVLLTLVLHDYFPLLLLQVVLWIWVVLSDNALERRWFWLVQLGYGGLLLALGVGLKLPPRIGLPFFNFWTLSNLLYVFRAGAETHNRRLATILTVLALAAVPYSYKTLHRRTILQAERQHNQLLRQQLTATLSTTALLITDVLPATYKSASPFRNPDARPTKILMLTGWTTADPSQAAWRQQLTGTRHFAAAMRQLAEQRPKVRWLLTPGIATLLNYQLQRLPANNGERVLLLPEYKVIKLPADTIRYYQPTVETVK